MSTSRPTSSHSDHSRLTQIKDYFLKRESTSAAQADFLTGNFLAANLFSKVSAEFLESHTLEDLVSITERGLALLTALNKDPKSVQITFGTLGKKFTISAALADRPFIINTIAEAVRSKGGDITTFIHPILRSASGNISLSYLEIDQLPLDVRPSLEAEIATALNELLLVTDDFPAMLVRTDTLARVMSQYGVASTASSEEIREISEFLRWLTDGAFIFLGHAEWHTAQDGSTIPLVPATALGVFKSSAPYAKDLFSEIRADAALLLEHGSPYLVSTLRTQSIVHRGVRMTHFTVIEPTSGGATKAVHSIVGMLTSRARSQESSGVPLIRRTLRQLLEAEEAAPNTYTYKHIVNFVDNMPKEVALASDAPRLREVITRMLAMHSRHETSVSVLVDAACRSATVIVMMPRDRFSAESRRRLQRHVEQLCDASSGSSEYRLDVSDKTLARFYFSVAIGPRGLQTIDQRTLERQIAELSRTWRDQLEETQRNAPESAGSGRSRYLDAFPAGYQATQTIADALLDIEACDSLSEKAPLTVRYQPPASPGGNFTLVVYQRDQEISLSKALPVLENAGLEVLNQRSAVVAPIGSPQFIVQRFHVRVRSGAAIDQAVFDRVIRPGLTEIFLGTTANDPLNQLLITAGLDLPALSVLRTYGCLLSQINKFATRHAIFNGLAATPQLAERLCRMFEIRFNPARGETLEQRNELFKKELGAYRDQLSAITDLAQDRILRGLSTLLESTVRTNFYARRSAIALKLHSEFSDIMPQPRPKFEIFVSSPVVEGIHLRSSMVARGGLRWSDRKDDYRTEVLGLMKTQKTKNAVIVPSGAKGGFIVKNLPEDGTKARAAVEHGYSEFIRALLSLADNRVDGAVVHPRDTVIYDAPDPYFVVAADKGTATFSDIANRIAIEEFNFWLGDAFASGGSVGYDHKKYGITAKGVWECVKRHFNELGIDFEHAPFTAVGVGDMSGDVFGNGLLLSRNYKLLAAFDHRSIFIDPSPDPERSFKERERLFALPRSQWSDYSPELISKGGGVYNRSLKEITLSPEARKALSVSDDTPASVSGEQLISLILKAKVDLLWNGGIGTYVKSSSEAHSDVNDSSNDRVRVNADDLRARIVGEGGNLGFTQLARREFAQRGGKINTDAIDNSAGVDLSDHEVNLKILLGRIIGAGKLSVEERNQLLRDMSGDVVEAVLAHNRSHALALSMAEQRSRRVIDYYRSLIIQMSKLGYLNRALESLPEDDELGDRATRKEGLLRPELAVCLAVVKMWAKDALLASEVPADPLLSSMLLGYFPETLVNRYREEILLHPLGRNIVATQVANEVIDSIGISFLHRMCLNEAAEPIAVLKCAIAAYYLLEMDAIRKDLRVFDTARTNAIFFSRSMEAARALRAVSSWLLSVHGNSLSATEMVNRYAQDLRSLIHRGAEILQGKERDSYQRALEQAQKEGVSATSAPRVAAFQIIIPILEMAWTSATSVESVSTVADVYSATIDKLRVADYVTLGHPIPANSKWENELRINSYKEIRKNLSSVVSSLLASGVSNGQAAATTLHKSRGYERLIATVEELRQDKISVAGLSVVARQLKLFEATMMALPGHDR